MARLIDADKLYPDCMTKEGTLAISQSQIANAPTVEPFEPDYVGAERLKARQRGYEEGYHRGMEIGKTLNPKIKQGEWIYIGQRNGLKVVECTNCHKRQYGSMKYCGNCGADMRGEKNETDN